MLDSACSGALWRPAFLLRHRTVTGDRLVPRQPLGRVARHIDGPPLQRGQVVKRVRPAQLGRVDEAHEDVAVANAFLGLVEERVVPMHDGLLEHPLGAEGVPSDSSTGF